MGSVATSAVPILAMTLSTSGKALRAASTSAPLASYASAAVRSPLKPRRKVPKMGWMPAVVTLPSMTSAFHS
jgi:hypothetical protein